MWISNYFALVHTNNVDKNGNVNSNNVAFIVVLIVLVMVPLLC